MLRPSRLPQIIAKLKQPSIGVMRLLMLLAVFAVVGMILVLRFATIEEERELTHWQNKLGLIADSRAADINSWIDRHFRELGEVANNPSLQLYITELLQGNHARRADPEEPAEVTYLRNLLLVTSDRLGFAAKSDALKNVRANVHKAEGIGMALVDMRGTILVSTEGLSSLSLLIAPVVAKAPTGTTTFIDMFTTESGEKQLGFIIPVYPIQADPVASEQIARLVAIKTVDDDLYQLLTHPGVAEPTLEAFLIRKVGGNVEYLSPPRENQEVSPLFSMSTPELDAAFAMNQPGDFAVKHDRNGTKVLATSRPIPHAGWVLLLHIEREKALAESTSWRRNMVAVMCLSLIAILATIFAAWWYGTSRKALLLTLQTTRLAAQTAAQEKLLRLVSDNQLESIFIVDANNTVRFANDKASDLFHTPARDSVGKDLSALLGSSLAEEYKEANKSALTLQKKISREHRTTSHSALKILSSDHIPLSHIPIDSLPYPSPGVLVVDQDVTEVVSGREHRSRILRELVTTLVRLVDARDHYAANHSAAVARVAKEVASSLELDTVMIETAEIAGNLMNIGKIVVPSEVLTKTTALDSNEANAIRISLHKAAELIEDVEFDGPVVETLRQASERYDGTGPLKLKGEDILITARIIAVANAFVGMMSPRSYRAALSLQAATKVLLDQIDAQFDRRVVLALLNFVENRHGKDLLSQLVLQKVA